MCKGHSADRKCLTLRGAQRCVHVFTSDLSLKTSKKVPFRTHTKKMSDAPFGAVSVEGVKRGAEHGEKKERVLVRQK